MTSEISNVITCECGRKIHIVVRQEKKRTTWPCPNQLTKTEQSPEEKEEVSHA